MLSESTHHQVSGASAITEERERNTHAQKGVTAQTPYAAVETHPKVKNKTRTLAFSQAKPD